MTPKEKSQEFFNRYLTLLGTSGGITREDWVYFNGQDAKQCALIAVDEIIEALDVHQWQNRNVIEYYTEVKNEIEQL